MVSCYFSVFEHPYRKWDCRIFLILLWADFISLESRAEGSLSLILGSLLCPVSELRGSTHASLPRGCQLQLSRLVSPVSLCPSCRPVFATAVLPTVFPHQGNKGLQGVDRMVTDSTSHQEADGWLLLNTLGDANPGLCGNHRPAEAISKSLGHQSFLCLD